LSFFIWLEATPASIWIRESPSLWGFPFILYLHTLGLALVAGLSSAVALAVLMRPLDLQAWPLARLFPLVWVGLAINALSGIALLIAYPAKALTNPVFYIKLIAIAAAVGIAQWLERQLGGVAGGVSATAATTAHADMRMRRAAFALLGLWTIATVTGRLLAYTHSTLLATFGI